MILQDENDANDDLQRENRTAEASASQDALTGGDDPATPASPELLDIVIVGGGIAGLYAAWRLTADQIPALNKLEQSSRESAASDEDALEDLCNEMPSEERRERQGDERKPVNPTLKVHLYEATGRLGGRLHSVRIPGVAVSAELGAMRYSTRHRLLTNLIVDHLKLPRKTFEFDVPQPAFFVRGRRLPAEDLRTSNCLHCSAPIPFSLHEGERGKLPEELIAHAIWSILAELNFSDPSLKNPEVARIRSRIRRRKLNKEDWTAIQKHGRFKDIHLYDIGFWNLLQHFLSNEAFLLAHDCLGYESIVDNWNAAEALPWFIQDFEPNQTLYMLPDGFRKLVSGMRRDIPGRVKVNCQHKLTLIERIAAPQNGFVWQLTFTMEDENFTDQEEKPTVKVKSKHLILALPRKALENLKVSETTEPKFAASWRKFSPKLEVVRSHRLFKLFLVYEHPWWKGHVFPGGENGRVFTDLPIRQVYYFGPKWIKQHATDENLKQAEACLEKFRKRREKEGTGQTPQNAHHQEKQSDNDLALVMASYSDDHYVNFWHPFSQRKSPGSSRNLPDVRHYRRRRDLFTEPADQQLQKIAETDGASERMVSKVQQQLAELHGIPIESIPDPIASIFMDWGQAGYEGGWHTWEVHTKPWEFIEDELDKLAAFQLYLCGEAYSREQGWIEGALKSTEQALLKIKLKISRESSAFQCDIPHVFPNEDDYYEHIDMSKPKTGKPDTTDQD